MNCNSYPTDSVKEWSEIEQEWELFERMVVANRKRNKNTIEHIMEEIIDKIANDTPPEKKGKGDNQIAIQNEDLIINQINNSETYSSELLKKMDLSANTVLAVKVNKNYGFKVTHTETWTKLKHGTKERGPTSKADMCLMIDDKKVPISIKTGAGRITSSDYCETSAILRSVFENKYRDKQDSDKIKEIIDEIISQMKTAGKYTPPEKIKNPIKTLRNQLKVYPDSTDEGALWMKKVIIAEIICNDLWKTLKNEHTEFVKDVLFEGSTGEYKFGDNDGHAEWLLVTKKQSQEIDKLFNLHKRTEELDAYLWNCAKSPNAFKCKSATTMWMRFL